MAPSVLIHRQDSIYDDSPAERYQFPGQYLGRVRASVGDWIVYYEPRSVDQSRGYFAVAKIEQVVPDPVSSNMYLALITPGTYLDFAQPVPFSDDNGVVERGLLNPQGRLSGRAQSAVRPISSNDLERILELGLEQSEPSLPRVGPQLPTGFAEPQSLFSFEESRDRVQSLSSRIIRDRVFRQVVLRAYHERCAVTGLRLINGGGRAEVAAAHIRPVDANGPDCVSNGLALSGTAHWMFDRGMISLTDDLEILISRQVNDLEGVRNLISRTGRAFRPDREIERPHPHFLAWHREHCFKH